MARPEDMTVEEHVAEWRRLRARGLRDSFPMYMYKLGFGPKPKKKTARDRRIEELARRELLKDNPKAGMTYLAIMPRARKPKAVNKGEISYYQKEAREFYEAPGMTAAEAREAIKEGYLKPTWIKGQPVVAYSVATGEPRTEARIFMSDLMKQVEKSGDRDAVLRIGRNIYQPQYSYQPRHVYRPGGKPGGTNMTWHDTDISGFTYDPTPLSHGQLERHLRNKDEWEMVWIGEDYNGIPMGGIVVLAQSGMGLERMNDESVRAKLSGLSGRRWRSRQRVDGGMIREADLEWSY